MRHLQNVKGSEAKNGCSLLAPHVHLFDTVVCLMCTVGHPNRHLEVPDGY